MREIALHLLDIAENSVAAQAKNITISVCEDLWLDRFWATVVDDGVGMDEQMVAQVTDPFVTSRTTRKVGLGIPLFKAAAEACAGYLQIDSRPGQGTRLEVEFQHSHIDRMPLGDLSGTFLTLIVAYPQVRWVLEYQAKLPILEQEAVFTFDTQPLREQLGDISFTEPVVLAYLRQLLEEGVSAVQQALVAAIDNGITFTARSKVHVNH